MTAGVDRVVVAGDVVTKHHGGPDGAVRAARSFAAMEAARAAGMPVPTPLDLDGAVLRIAAVRSATAGIAALTEDPVRLLRRIGRIARRLHVLPPPGALPVVADGGVWVHGDLCPVNVLVDRDGIAAVIDWEDSRVDDPLVDLVWTEWLVRSHHPEHVVHLGALYDGYGTPPPPPDRRRAVMRRSLVRRREREDVHPATWGLHLDALRDLDLNRPFG